ncbi:uncharacterized protein LOC117641142 isoform X2 [Thrips palmi]|uniref:Uncharacterized protein LOC117641142 isoform X2 n=1 Tax=Thrips palmi TaxID=161013 RepID=A0A6P8ZIT3_THRPL|nr:uncharacterized protein LOC117641142 isoform X2 [Thrips palmi]
MRFGHCFGPWAVASSSFYFKTSGNIKCRSLKRQHFCDILELIMRLIVVGDCVSLKRKTHPSKNNGTDKSVDWKGIKRGSCQAKECVDCDAYTYNPSKGAQCQYCGCYPTKHRRIQDDDTIAPKIPRLELEDDERQAPEIHIIDNGSDTLVYEVDDEGNVVPDDDPLELLAEQLPSLISTQVEPAILKNKAIMSNCASVSGPPASVSSFSKSALMKKKEIPSQTVSVNLNNKSTFEKMLQPMSKEQLYELCVPSRLPMRINFPRDSESLPKSDAQFVIRWIAWSMWNVRVTAEQDFKNVADLALKRYPTLESIFPKEKSLDGMVKFLKQFLGHRDVEKKKKEKEVVQPKQIQQQKSEKENTVSNIKQFETLKSHIYKEMEKLNPSIAVLRTFLSSCRKERKLRLSKEKQNYSTQLQEFPCLGIQELVLWEFISQEQLQCTPKDLKKRWQDAISSMASYFLSESEKTFDSPLTEEEATSEILQCLTCPKHFGPEMSEDKRSHLVLEVLQGSTMPLFAPKHDPPRLFSLGEDENQTTYVYVEGKAVYKGPIMDALLYIVAIYYVFEFSPSFEATAAFSFIYGILLKEKAFDKYMHHRAVVEALELIWASQ